jgi:hypothetical protein
VPSTNMPEGWLLRRFCWNKKWKVWRFFIVWNVLVSGLKSKGELKVWNILNVWRVMVPKLEISELNWRNLLGPNPFPN